MQDLFEGNGEQTYLLNYESLLPTRDNVIKDQNNLIAWNVEYCGKMDYTPLESTHSDGGGEFTLLDSMKYDSGSSNNLADAVQCFNVKNETDDAEPDSKRTRKRNLSHNSTHRRPCLPPCQICGEIATGFHYGANTCEACKGFFRRNLRKAEIKYKCRCTPEQQEAWKRGPRKDNCQSCRYGRCLAVGMSRNAIKLGRYTYTHKTRNINQAKYHEAVNSCKEEIHTFSENSSSSSCTPSPSYSSLSRLYSGPCSPENETVSSSMDRHNRPLGACHSSPLQNGVTTSRVHLENMGLSLQEIQSAVETLTEAHIAATFQPDMSMEIIKRKHTEYLESYISKPNNKTEADISIQKQHVANLFNLFEDKIIKAVSFAKKIPGFRDLTLDDQASLIKGSRVEITLFGGYKYLVTHLDKERKMITTPWGEELHLDELNQVLPIDIVMMRYKYAKRLDELRLSTQELSVLQAIITISPDRCVLEQPDKVDALQQKLVTCLEYLLRNRPGGAGSLLYKIFNLMTDLRELTEIEGELSKKMLSEWPALSKDSFHLLKELST